MNRYTTLVLALVATLTLMALALAHETRLLGPEGGKQYNVTVGQLNEPAFTEVRTGLDLIIRNAEDDTPVEGLENSLEVTITAPTGETRTLEVRPQFRQPGRYTDDYILTVPGTYQIRVRGFIGDLEIDETYPREVEDGQDLRFP